ncbi:hypothetical protein GCM10027020_05780 [Nocardioides salsibiostraticola]
MVISVPVLVQIAEEGLDAPMEGGVDEPGLGEAACDLLACHTQPDY